MTSLAGGAAGNPFSHPYTPYPIQTAFMTRLYGAIRDGKAAVLESPTGTVRGGSEGQGGGVR